MTVSSRNGRRAVIVCDHEIIKRQEPERSRRERLRTTAGRAVGEQTGLFVVPRIIRADDVTGEIVFERLTLVEFREALSDRSRSLDLIGRAAQALAAIHGRLEPMEGARRSAPSIGPGRPLVPLHGDFGMRNVFACPPGERIAVIDWANADWVGIEEDLGPPELDIAVFIISLFHRRVFGRWPLARRHDLARHFLATYADQGPYGADLGSLTRVVTATTPAFARLTRQRTGLLLALASRHALIDLRFFLRRLSRSGP